MDIQKKQFVFALLAAAGSIERRLNRLLSAGRGISFTEYCLLDQLLNLHGSATRVDLARAIHLTPSAVTRALKPLEKIGFVVTQKGQRDARQNIASLTPAGEELLKDARNLINDELDTLPLPRPAPAELMEILNNLAPQHH